MIGLIVPPVNGLIAAATIFVGAGFLLADMARMREGQFSALSFFSMAAILSGVGDMSVASQVARGNLDVLQYGVAEYYSRAIFLTYVGSALPHVGAHAARVLCRRRRRSVLPAVEYIVSDERKYLSFIIFAAILVLVLNAADIQIFTGLLANIFDYFPAMAVFLLARHGYRQHDLSSILWAMGISAFLSFNAALNAYLRGEIIFPWLMLVIGSFVGRPKRDIFISPPFLLSYGIFAVFFVYFFAMGIVRQEQVYGMKRIERLVETKNVEERYENAPVQKSPWQRNANVNKLSAIMGLVDKNGFYRGESLDYMRYAFIPRIIWPDKPIIQQGGWFAKEIKMGREVGGGRHSNAINMTIPGELYLNFGWPGVVAGCIGVGFLIMLIWESTGFWTQPFNLTGSMLAFMLIKRCYEFLGPDLQSIVGYIAGYLSLLGLSYLARSLFPQAPRVSSSHVTGWKGRGRWSRMARTP